MVGFNDASNLHYYVWLIHNLSQVAQRRTRNFNAIGLNQ